MPKEYVEKLRDCWQNEKEITVLGFLKGIFDVIKFNMEQLNINDLKKYNKTFSVNNVYIQMIESFINVMNKKINRAETEETKSIKKLQLILVDADELKTIAQTYFKSHS